MARAPEEIDAEEREQLVARVAAIDVAKASGKVCTRVPHETVAGRRVTTVWEVPATTNAIVALSDHLACPGIERVVVESTSDNWRPFLYLVEAGGSTPGWSTRATSSKVPGRPKTDLLTELPEPVSV